MHDKNWKQITARLKTGKIVGPGLFYRKGEMSALKAYKVISTDDKGITAERLATGSRVRVTRAAIEKADARLEAGVLIPRRAINYTVAIETLIIISLGDSVTMTTDDAGVDCYVRPGRR